MNKFIKSLELRWSDLLLLIGVGSFAFFIGFGQNFMAELNPNKTALPSWAVIVLGLVMIGAFIGYLYLELYIRKVKYNRYILFTFIFLLLLNVIVIFATPSTNYVSVIVRAKLTPTLPEGEIGDVKTLAVSVSTIHKFFFAFELFGTLALMYCTFFIFSKRIKNLKFIEYLGYAVFAIGVFLTLYSYITEGSKYYHFINYFMNKLKGTPESVDIIEYTVMSVFSHRNPLGMAYMLCIIFAFINHSFHKYWWHYLIAAFFFINLIFTFNKTGLLISLLVILIYLIYRLIVTFKEHKKRNTITAICVGTIVVIGVLLIAIPYITKGRVFGKIYELIDELTKGGSSLDYRGYIWDNTYVLLQNGRWLIGRGFGIMNMLLRPMNYASHGEDVISTHSGYLNNLAEGGILYLAAFIILIGYVSYIAYKSFKKERDLTISIYLGVLVFVLYAFVETNHYLAYLFMFPIFVLYHNQIEQKE